MPMEVLPTPDQELDWRLAGVEERLEAISERLGRLEVALRDAVAEEVHEATAELRHAISELGRRLVQDLPSQLARHRDAIVAELRPPPPPPPPPPAPPPPADPAEPAVDVDATDSEGEVDMDETPEAAERRRVSRRRRRQS
jgi:hypothetical protein